MSTIEKNSLKLQIWAAAGTMIAAVLLQSAAALFWAGTITARMTNVESNLVRCEERLHNVETTRSQKPFVASQSNER